jgi:hypothetical protein
VEALASAGGDVFTRRASAAPATHASVRRTALSALKVAGVALLGMFAVGMLAVATGHSEDERPWWLMALYVPTFIAFLFAVLRGLRIVWIWEFLRRHTWTEFDCESRIVEVPIGNGMEPVLQLTDRVTGAQHRVALITMILARVAEVNDLNDSTVWVAGKPPFKRAVVSPVGGARFFVAHQLRFFRKRADAAFEPTAHAV